MEIERLLCDILREIADATESIEIEDTDCGTMAFPVLRYVPTFSFTKEDIDLIKGIADNTGEDFSAITECFIK